MNALSLDDYRRLAIRTINPEKSKEELIQHAKDGMISEIGELFELYPRPEADMDHIKKEIGDVLWFIAEYCTMVGWNMDEVIDARREVFKFTDIVDIKDAMIGRIGNFFGLHQKVIQGHEFDETRAMRELGGVLWYIHNYCSVMGWNILDVAQLNIDKLRARYPEGFEVDRSLHRAEGDI